MTDREGAEGADDGQVEQKTLWPWETPTILLPLAQKAPIYTPYR